MTYSVLNNLIACDRQMGIVVENTHLIDRNEYKLLHLNAAGIPLTRSCFRPFIDLAIKAADFFVRHCTYELSFESWRITNLADVADKEIENLTRDFEQRRLSPEEKNYLRETRSVCQKVREAAIRIWDEKSMKPRTPPMARYCSRTCEKIEALLQA